MIDKFYIDVLNRELARGTFSKNDRILILCGGPLDKNCLLAVGAGSVTVSNIGPFSKNCDDFSPYQGRVEDAESLSANDQEYDVVIVHSGLHHCYSPHRAIAEMCRVAKKAVIGFEPYENCLTRIGSKLGLGQDYELAAVAANHCVAGGVANTAIPNYVYRFGKRELTKTLACLRPFEKPNCRFYFALRFNAERAAKFPLYKRIPVQFVGKHALLVSKLVPVV